MDSFKTDSSMKKSDSYRSKIADAKPPIKKIHKKFRLQSIIRNDFPANLRPSLVNGINHSRKNIINFNTFRHRRTRKGV